MHVIKNTATPQSIYKRTYSTARNGAKKAALPLISKTNETIKKQPDQTSTVNPKKVQISNNVSTNNNQQGFILDCTKVHIQKLYKEYDPVSDPMLTWYFARPRMKKWLQVVCENKGPGELRNTKTASPLQTRKKIELPQQTDPPIFNKETPQVIKPFINPIDAVYKKRHKRNGSMPELPNILSARNTNEKRVPSVRKSSKSIKLTEADMSKYKPISKNELQKVLETYKKNLLKPKPDIGKKHQSPIKKIVS